MMKTKKLGLFALGILLITSACFLGGKPTEAPLPPLPPAPPTDAPTGGSGQGDFRLNSANPVLPDSVLDEVAYFSQGGDGSCLFTPPGKLEMDQPPQSAELYESLAISSCGWNPGDLVTVTVTDPVGMVTQKQQEANQGMGESAWAAAWLYPTLPGEYMFSFQGPGGQVDFRLPVFVADGPRLFSMRNDNVLMLYHLQPNERVTILAYQPKQEGIEDLISFVGSQDFYADDKGFLVVRIPNDFLLYFAIGEVSGNLEDSNGFMPLRGSIFK